MGTEVKTAIGKFVWHENHSNDPEKAKSFYGELLGWETEIFKPGEMDYAMIKANGQTHGGFMQAQGGAPPHWLSHILVQDVDDTATKAEAAGGKIIAGPMDIPEVGRFALISDPQRAVFSAFASAGDPPEGEGVFVWDELLTTDIEAATQFYTEIIGWKTRTMDMGPGGTYTIFQRAGEVDTAGGMNRPPGMEAPPNWLPYIGTQDVDGTVERAKELGATIFMEPTDLPNNMGRFAVIQDPVGAAVGIFQGTGT